MKRRIYMNFLGLILPAVLLLSALLSFFFYNAFRSREIETVKDSAALIADFLNCGIKGDLSDYISGGSPRMVIIAPDGTVLIDNQNEADTLENHSDRVEVQDALRTGTGEATRYSSTLKTQTYYYAVRLNDGSVLRLSKSVGNIEGVFTSSIPAVLIVTALILLSADIFARRLTKNIVRPVGNIDFDGENVVVYDELMPYAKKIAEQRREIEEQMSALRNRADTITARYEAEKQRREFSANVSHELKTPLTSISALSEMIGNGMAEEKDIKDFAARISEQAGRLMNIIEDIIKLSEFDEERADREYRVFNIYELAEEVASALSGNDRGIKIVNNGENFKISANHRMMEELLYNLIDNGIKYNKPGGNVTLMLSREKDMCKIAVSDTGIGIPPEHQARVFERFYRVDKSRSKKTGGTGLGLSIVKHIVEHHGGNIELNSAEGAGTTVTCRIPVGM